MRSLRTPSSLLGFVVATWLAAGCGARSELGVWTMSAGVGGSTGTTSSSAASSSAASSSAASSSTASSGGGGAMSTSSIASSSASSASSSSGTGGMAGCTSDGECPAGEFCWLGACVKIAAVTLGAIDGCTLTSAGSVQCWGNDILGQLGEGSMLPSPVPGPVPGLGSGVAGVAVGWEHICALTTAGGVQCLGSNFAGQLGDGSTTDSSVLVPVSGLSSGIAAIAANEDTTCALTPAGGVQCWGDNAGGQLGDGSTTDSSVPIAVSGLAGDTAAIAVGGSHVCVLSTGGAVSCWGSNDHGQLGDGSTTDSLVPVAVSGLSSGIAAIAAGFEHTCAVSTAGSLQCWGSNIDGALGDGSTIDSHVPVNVAGLSSGVAQVVAGGGHTCALTTTGGVQCWGDGSSGQLGDGATEGSAVPVAVPALSAGVAALSAQGLGTCALTTAGGVECWGQNVSGELGDGTTNDSAVPVKLAEP
jgi:alpha-tubulin suppressor-like RCC1 family protein